MENRNLGTLGNRNLESGKSKIEKWKIGILGKMESGVKIMRIGISERGKSEIET